MKQPKIPTGWRKLRVGEYANRMDKFWNFLSFGWYWWEQPKSKILNNGSIFIRKKK